MYRSEKKCYYRLMNVLALFAAVAFEAALLSINKKHDAAAALPIAFLVFFTFTRAAVSMKRTLKDTLVKKHLYGGRTRVMMDFVERLRSCYTFEDLAKASEDILELQADSTVLFINKIDGAVLYNSPGRMSSKTETLNTLAKNYSYKWKDGFYFMSDTLGLASSSKNARGFFMAYKKKHFYVFNRYTSLFDESIYARIYQEFRRFMDRYSTISNLAEINELTKEWEKLAETQVSFLPHPIPQVRRLDLAAYYRPLVNVSGDYYSVLPINEDKTFLMLGDVSGKGLAAALIMSLVINTVKAKENKEDLHGVHKAVDKAIKRMKLQDKYTVLFIGIIDTKEMKITYINASMSDPVRITREDGGYRIIPLESSAGIVGILDIVDAEVREEPLKSGDTILLASDGISEVMNDKGIEVSDTELFPATLKKGAMREKAENMVQDIVDMIFEYNGNARLHDDVTMLVTKIK